MKERHVSTRDQINLLEGYLPCEKLLSKRIEIMTEILRLYALLKSKEAGYPYITRSVEYESEIKPSINNIEVTFEQVAA